MKIYIRNMVCDRCSLVVRETLNELEISFVSVGLGEANLAAELSVTQRVSLQPALLKSGFQLLNDRKSIFIQKIKNIIIELVHYAVEPLRVNLSDFLSEKLNRDYTYLANLFSSSTGVSVEKFFIMHRIERVKELLFYNELTLTQIACKMHYSSVAHLSNQFKKVTGFTPSIFKKDGRRHRFMLEEIGN